MSGERFGQLLRQHRLAAGLSQNQLAYHAEIDAAYVNRLELHRPTNRRCGPSTPSVAIIGSLARVLRLDPRSTDRLLIAAGHWPWPEDAEAVERALAAVHGDVARRRTG
jgi:transcriptional regulator with XRE-family HTH domain